MIEGRAFAKLSLSLHVSSPGPGGLHPVRGRFQSIDWADVLTLDTAESDRASNSRGGVIIDDMDNLAWRAAASVRSIAPSRPPLELTLDKELPVAAGVGGGSADAAAALAMAAALLGVDRSDAAALAPELGSDVPFCFLGGSATIGGYGERVEPLPAVDGFSFGLVVPPFEVATPAVYRRWDSLGEPSGSPLPPSAVPPVLRDEPLVNDLQRAAVAVAPEIDEWRRELEHRWGRPVALAGSGPTLFAFFLDVGEATDALAAVPSGARAAAAARPVDYGWKMHIAASDTTTDSRGRRIPGVAW